MKQPTTEREVDGRWIAEAPELPGVMVYGGTREKAIAGVEILVLRVLAENIKDGWLPIGHSAEEARESGRRSRSCRSARREGGLHCAGCLAVFLDGSADADVELIVEAHK